MVAWGGVWLLGGACVVAPLGAWLLGEHVWLLWGACMAFSGGCAWLFSGGACMVSSRGCAWFFQGVLCMVFSGGHGFFWGAWMVFPGGGMHGFFRGVCVVFSGGACVRYDKIRSMSGQYTSYWNAFLFSFKILTTNVKVYFTVFLLNTVCCLFSRKIC